MGLRFEGVVLALWVLSLEGCFLSHGGRGEGSPSRDAGVRVRDDGGVLVGDASAPADAGPVTPRRDAGPSSCPSVVVLDRRMAEWPSLLGCGAVGAARTVFRSGGFDLIAREDGSFCDRSALTSARRVSVTHDLIELGEDRAIMEDAAGRELAAAARGDTLVVATGVTGSTFWGAYEEQATGILASPPGSMPDCPVLFSVSHAVPWPGGFFFAFEYFECDIAGSQYGFYDDRLAAVSMLGTVWDRIGSAAPYENGAAFLARPRFGDGVAPLTLFEDATSPPATYDIAVPGSRVAATVPWPFGAPSSLALVFAGPDEDGASFVELVVVAPDGSTPLRRRALVPDPQTLAGYGVADIDVAVADFGLVVALSFGWDGGREDSALAVLPLGPDGTLLGGVILERDLGLAAPCVSVASDGPRALVSMFRPGSTPTVGESILMACTP